MNGSQADFDVRRRWLLVVATGKYLNDGQWYDLDVDSEVKVWRDWLCAPDLDARQFEQVAVSLARDPSLSDLRNTLASEEFIGRDGVRPNDALVAVVTGHGTVINGVHRVVLSPGDIDQPDRTMARTDELIGLIRDTGIEHAFIVIDTCEAGAAGEAILRYDRPLPATFTGLLASSPRGTAQLGAVARAVQEFLTEDTEKNGGPNQQYFTPQALMNHITNSLAEHEQRVVSLGALPLNRPTPCLPNPRFVSTHAEQVTTAPARQNMALRWDDLEAHWGPRARGVQRHDEAGWLFTGRTTLVRTLIDALSGPPRVFVVTGSAGSGKSAVLSRIVTLSDPIFRADHRDLVSAIPSDVRPEQNLVTVAVHAQGKTPVEVLRQLADGLGIPPTDSVADGPGKLLGATDPAIHARLIGTWLADRGPATIVIDALDEATDPPATLRKVLAPLCLDWTQPELRIVIGVRSPAPQQRTDKGSPLPRDDGTLLTDVLDLLHGHEIRVDTAPMWERTDLVDYLREVLLSPAGQPSVYEGHEALAANVAERLADAVAPSYLIGQIVARSLAAASEPRAADDPVWVGQVQAGLGEVLRAEIESAFPQTADRTKALALLRATALSFGPGLPWSTIWPTVASALADLEQADQASQRKLVEFTDADIRWLLGTRIDRRAHV